MKNNNNNTNNLVKLKEGDCSTTKQRGEDNMDNETDDSVVLEAIQALIFKGLSEKGNALLSQLQGKTLTKGNLMELFTAHDDIETALCEKMFQ